MPRVAPLAKRIVHCRHCGASVVLCQPTDPLALRDRRQLVAMDAMPITNRVFRIDDTVDPPELLPVEEVYQLHNPQRCAQLAARMRGLDENT